MTDFEVSTQTKFSPYELMDQLFNKEAKGNIGWEALLGARPPSPEAGILADCRNRYRVIKSFQQSVLEVFAQSLNGKRDPLVSAMPLGDLPDSCGLSYHKSLSPEHMRTPIFFRTDEPQQGKCSEIQCPGSGWALAELIRCVADRHPEFYGQPESFVQPPAAAVADSMRSFLDAEPIVHHLVDNASRPHGMRYFIERTRKSGVRYFSYDRDVSYSDCRLVRSHDFVSLLNHNFFAERMELCRQGRVYFDLPPVGLFDGKLIMAWPFWSRTRDAFSDDHRRLFPYTAVIEPDKVELPDGSEVTLEEFLRLPGAERDFFVKYAGTDVGINWGSRAVYLARTLSRGQAADLAARIRADMERNRFWVIQQSLRKKEPVSFWTRDGELQTVEANVKWSSFYGPGGLLALLAFHRPSHKVHGSTDTVLSLVR
jgi:hypothetical protein